MAKSSSDTAFLVHEKSFLYRGVREHWQNAYHLDNVPATASVWQALSDLVWSNESQFLPADAQLEWRRGYNPGTPPLLVWEVDVPPAGEGGTAGAFIPGGSSYRAPGDAASWIRWGTTQKTSLGKPIFLRNYFHAVYVDATGDNIVAQQQTPLTAFATAFQTGFSAGGVTFRRAGPRGAVAQNHSISTHATTRTLKHRGRRRALYPKGTTIQLPPIQIN